MARKAKYENLRDACVEEAMKIIETDGIEKLSLREVSRRLGVSHQAPYKHFASRDHILAEILERSFDDFADYLDGRAQSDDPYANLAAMGQAYIQYAADKPLQYRLMFGTPLPDPAQHPAMKAKAQHAFSLLRDAISQMPLASDPDMNALFVWSTMHGLAGIMHMEMFDDLSITQHDVQPLIQHVLLRIGAGLAGDTVDAQDGD